MLWHRSYNTWEAAPSPWIPLIAQSLNGDAFVETERFVLIGGFDLRSQAEIGIWERLLDESLTTLPRYIVLFLGQTTPKLEANLQAMFQRSKWDALFICREPSAWIELIRPDIPGRTFCGIVNGNQIDPLLIGLATEEAWERFEALL